MFSQREFDVLNRVFFF